VDCPNCRNPLDVHRTGDCLIGYCETCGTEVREKRDPPRERWTDEERAARLADPHRAAEKKKEPAKPRKPKDER
jgi:hypothetical protein